MISAALIALLRPVQFPGKARVLTHLCPTHGTRWATVHGARVQLDLGEHIQRMVYLGAYERWETRVVRRMLRPGMCFVDVGSNVGYFTLLAARRVGPSGRVVAVEPSRYAGDRLAQTLASNRISNVLLERIGLGRTDGETTLYDPLPDNYSPSMHGDPGSPGSTVSIRRLDDCLDRWGVKRVDLLKVDVEGHEPAVFDGGANALSDGRIRAVLCEFNAYWLDRAGTTPDELRTRLLKYGYRDVSSEAWDGNRPSLNRLFIRLDGNA
jgi:FkbM family methyltransferase